MITDNLLEEILLKPAEKSDELYIISGYASPYMINFILSKHSQLKINLIVGMAGESGIGKKAHEKFLEFEKEKFNSRFECRYYTKSKGDHSKLYAWFNSNLPVVGYNGSINFTMNGFLLGQGNSVSEDDPFEIKDRFNDIYDKTISATEDNIDEYINLIEDSKEIQNKQTINLEEFDVSLFDDSDLESELKEVSHCEISLLSYDGKGDIHQKAGLNWGQRPGRERNQAYIPIPKVKTDFFPIKNKEFKILTDDGKQFSVKRTQAGGKAIETPENNSILGKYFRERIGVDSGGFVTKDNLINYGRTSVDFYKLDDDIYYMDFSV